MLQHTSIQQSHLSVEYLSTQNTYIGIIQYSETSTQEVIGNLEMSILRSSLLLSKPLNNYNFGKNCKMFTIRKCYIKT